MIGLSELKQSLLHLLFPHNCCGCGSDVLHEDSQLCLRCLTELPATNFHLHANNPVEKIFWGRLPLYSATSQFYFTSESLVQKLMHQLKYRGNKLLGRQLGRLMGNSFLTSNRFNSVEVLIPLPLHKYREKKRGYNQATVLCEGIAEVVNAELVTNAVTRPEQTETQTSKGRIERWGNMEGRFHLINADDLAGKNVMLVDDVVTTGATLEACGKELMKVPGIRLSIATLCYTSS